MVTQVIMTPDMLHTLLQELRVDHTPTAVSNHGNFSQCTSRFSGGRDDVSAFIDGVSVYKECLNVSDENALKGLSMLLQGDAATWWQGIKSNVTSFDEALEALRHAYGNVKPAYQIYRELFSREQKADETTDLFISKARALLAKLPKSHPLPEAAQLDMVFGLLSPQVRERLNRDSCRTFKDLIEAARKVELAINERKGFSTTKSESEMRKQKLQCAYCRNYGHSKADCRKLANLSVNEAPRSPNQTDSTSKPPETRSSSLVCYGCGKVGHVRTMCPTHKGPRTSASSLEAEFFCQTFNREPCRRPMLEIQILKAKGYALVDTGAKSNIASASLRALFIKHGLPYNRQTLSMTLADGIERLIEACIFPDVIVRIGQRDIATTFISVEDHHKSRTLLGVEFIQQAGIVLDTPGNKWFFKDKPWQEEDIILEQEIVLTTPRASNLERTDIAEISAPEISEFDLRTDEGKTISKEEQRQLNTLLNRYSDLFSLEAGSESTPFAEHAIKLTDDVPISVPPYRMSEPKKEILQKELDKLLKKGFIEECESAYSSPVVLVPKKNGETRLCVDYQRLNAITQPDRYPLPRLDDLLHKAKQTPFMTTLDLKSGYHQISVRPADRDKTAFITPFGLFRYNVMPFGLRNAPSTFQRMIDRFRSGLQQLTILAYLDDLIILSETFNEHLQALQLVFERLKLFKLHLNRTKCSFACERANYLGHVITPQGILPSPEKTSAIQDMRPPQNVKQLLTFLQTCSWFRRFINNFAEVARPLTELTKKTAKWKWDKRQQEAFETLKESLISQPILRQADPTMPYILRTDASAYAIGAVLLQGEGPDERPVEYASRLLTSAERNYATTEREALAVVWSVEKFRGYLESSEVVIKSDHQPLRWLLSLKSPSGRLARWALTLQAYDLRIEYVPGRSNVIADTLSRPTIDATETNLVAVDMPTESAAKIRQAQLSDPDVRKIIQCFESPEPNEVDYKRWTERGYHMVNGILYRYDPELDEEEGQQIVPQSEVPTILKEYHNTPLAGHGGIERTIDRILKRYYWPSLRRDVKHYVTRCIDCQRYKPSNLKPSGLLQTPASNQRFEVLAMDLFGPLPETAEGDRWIFIIEDVATRWVELFSLKSATAEACAKTLIDEVILRYGVPRRVVSDNGTQFVSAVMQQTAHCLGFDQSLIPAYHPESNPVERRNRDLKTQIAIFVQTEHTKWNQVLPMVRFALNTAVCQTTGYTPSYLTFGRELRSPDDVHRDMRSIVTSENFVSEVTPHLRAMSKVLRQARERQELNQDRNKAYTDQHRRDETFKEGDEVLVDVHALSQARNCYTSKFAPRRDGPYLIVKQCSPTTFQIASMDEPEIVLGKYHVSSLRKFTQPEEPNPKPLKPIRGRGRPKLDRHREPPEIETRRVEKTEDSNHLTEREYEAEGEIDRTRNQREENICKGESRKGTRKRKKATRCPCCPNEVSSCNTDEDVTCVAKGEYVTDRPPRWEEEKSE